MEETKKNDTVNLSLDTYNQLRDFREDITKNNAVTIFWGWNNREVVYTIDDATKRLADANAELVKKIDELENPDKKQPTINDIKAMNWWQFRKWKSGKL